MSSFLVWFDENPARYWWIASVVLSVVFCTAARPLLRSEPGTEPLRPDWVWGLAILALLLAGRWPSFFISTDLNADESQMLAGAITLRYDPVFWRSVDGNTAGPLDFYALLPMGWLTGHDSYLSARLTALLLIAGALLYLHAAITRLCGKTAARLGGLSTLCFEAFTTHSDFLHYSTELVPLLLLSGGLCLGVREAFAEKPGWVARFCFGVLMGAVPFAKLQGVPLAALLAGALFFADTRKPRRSLRYWFTAWAAMIAGAFLPGLFFCAMVVACGEWNNAIISYLSSNVGYVTTNEPSLVKTLYGLFVSVAYPGDLVPYWLAGGVAMLLGALLAAQPWTHKTRWSFGLTASCLAVGTISVLVPSRPSPHYLQFLVLPITLLGGACTGIILQALRARRRVQDRLLLALIMLWGPLAVLAARFGKTHAIVGHMAASYDRPASEAVRIIRKITRPADSLAVWGWMSAYHVETGLRQALRESHSVEQIHAWSLQSFYRERYLSDMTKSDPAVFVDAVGSGNFAFHNRENEAHDAIFPELALLIHIRYSLVADVNGSRIYLRNDLLKRNESPPPTVNTAP